VDRVSPSIYSDASDGVWVSQVQHGPRLGRLGSQPAGAGVIYIYTYGHMHSQNMGGKHQTCRGFKQRKVVGVLIKTKNCVRKKVPKTTDKK